jgi:hypothetical protein
LDDDKLEKSSSFWIGKKKRDHFGGTKISPARYGGAELTALHSISI